MPTGPDVEAALKANLPDADVEVEDISSGCGTSFRVAVVSSQFEGKRLIERHRMINAALAEVMPGIHALTIAKAVPPTRA